MAEANNNSVVVEMLEVAIAGALAPEIAIIQGVNWSVGAGEYWVVGGSPGSGKSNLLATAAGLLRPASGVHRLFGREITGLEEIELIRERLRVGIVFGDEGRLFNQLTIAENLALPICYHQNCDAADVGGRVEEVLEITRLSEFAQRMPGNISRSLRPKIALARALALQPELLFLDNPLRETDPTQRRWWIEFVGTLSAGHRVLGGRRMTVVVATDDFRPWAGQAEKYALITGNRWRVIGGRADLAACDEPLLRELLHEEIENRPQASSKG